MNYQTPLPAPPAVTVVMGLEMCEHTPTLPFYWTVFVNRHSDNLKPPPPHTHTHSHTPAPSHKPKYGHVCRARWQDGGQWVGRWRAGRGKLKEGR